MSTDELKATYNNLPNVIKNGRKIEFYHSAFKKIYKVGGLLGQVIPVLDKVLEQSVLAYPESDSYGGQVRPDGTVHKEHKNVESFDNYVGKVNIGGKEYYVRSTVQKSRSEAGSHSFFVSQVDVYENPTESRTIPITSRGTTDISGIVDAKLQQFFEEASSELKEKHEVTSSAAAEMGRTLGVEVDVRIPYKTIRVTDVECIHASLPI